MSDRLPNRDAADAPAYVAPEVSYLLDRIVNVAFVGRHGAGDREWALVDCGLPGSAAKIRRAAASLFGEASRPAAIILTHGHFDHVGATHTLAHEWQVPIYAHELELPYLTGRSAYPPPDPLVGGGMMAASSILFPKAPIDLTPHVRALPSDGSVPGMPGWRWIPTPGHSPGHVSLVRDADRAAIIGDAFVTTKQESVTAALTQRAELHGPPMYFTPDWDTARRSVRHLADYAPTVVITGHGPVMRGARLQSELRELAARFDELARPRRGRYRDQPAVADATGVVSVPPPAVSQRTVLIGALAVGAAVGLAIALSRRDRGAGRADVEVPLLRADDSGESATADLAMAVEMRESAVLAAADGGYDPAIDAETASTMTDSGAVQTLIPRI